MKSSTHNIAILTWDYFPPKGGLGRAMRLFSDVLKDMGNQVAVLSPSGGDCTVAPLTKKIGLHHMFSACAFLRLPTWISRTGSTILIVPCGPGGVWLLRKPKHCTLIAIVHHTSLQQCMLVPMQGWKRIFIPFEKRTLLLADKVLCYGEESRRVLEERYGVQAQIIPHPVDVPPVIRTEKKVAGQCVCIARLEARKGTDVLLRAWENVEQANASARLILVGSGHLEKKTDLFIERLQSVSRISSLPREDLLRLIARSEILVSPSYLEGFGLTVAEAMALGTAVVACRADGITSLLAHEKSGVLTELGNSDELACEILALLKDKDRRSSLLRQAQHDFRNRFSSDALKTALHDVLDSLY